MHTIPYNFKIEGSGSKMDIDEGKYLVGCFKLNDVDVEKGWNTMYMALIKRDWTLREDYIYAMSEFKAQMNLIFSSQ